MRCFCEQEIPNRRCEDPEKYKHVHIEYYGECKSIPDCEEGELEDFPRRMREWLFNVMEELAGRGKLTPHFSKLHKDGEFDLTKKWTNAAIWKWCDLDGHPHDNVVSRHELFPVRAPLQSLEHCIGDFLDNCDENDDHDISFQEWAKCLEIDGGELEAKCQEL